MLNAILNNKGSKYLFDTMFMNRFIVIALVLSTITVLGAGCSRSTDTANVVNAAQNMDATVTNANVMIKDITAALGEEFTVKVNQAALVSDRVEVMVSVMIRVAQQVHNVLQPAQ